MWPFGSWFYVFGEFFEKMCMYKCINIAYSYTIIIYCNSHLSLDVFWLVTRHVKSSQERYNWSYCPIPKNVIREITTRREWCFIIIIYSCAIIKLILYNRLFLCYALTTNSTIRQSYWNVKTFASMTSCHEFNNSWILFLLRDHKNEPTANSTCYTACIAMLTTGDSSSVYSIGRCNPH